MLLLAVTIWHSKFHIGYKKKMNYRIQNPLSLTPSLTPHLSENTEKVEFTLPEKWPGIPRQVSSVKVEMQRLRGAGVPRKRWIHYPYQLH